MIPKMVREQLAANDYWEWMKTRSNRPVRKILGVKISEDHGRTWSVKALCLVCISKFDPPTRIKTEIEAASLTCDKCGALNEMFRARSK